MRPMPFATRWTWRDMRKAGDTRRFWLAEHHNMRGIASAATSVLIGYVAGGTSTIRVGSGGIMLPNHASLVIAEQFGTLETLYPGRIDLGVGRAPGSDEAASRALRYNPTEEDFPRQVAELLAYLASGWSRAAAGSISGRGHARSSMAAGLQHVQCAIGCRPRTAVCICQPLRARASVASRRNVSRTVSAVAIPGSAVPGGGSAGGRGGVRRGGAIPGHLRFCSAGLRLIRRQPIFVPPPAGNAWTACGPMESAIWWNRVWLWQWSAI